jgi:3-aminobutanoyl-CoA transaminase
MQRDKVLETIWDKGRYMMEGIRQQLDKYDVGANLNGIPPMMFITFDKNESGTYKAKRKDFYTQLIRRKVFLQPYHHGYICYRHTKDDLDYTIYAIGKAMEFVKNKYND